MLITDATNLHRLMNCNGSRLMSPSFPTVDLDDPTARDEGNAADWLAEQWFNGAIDAATAIGIKAPNGVLITGEMIDFVSQYLFALTPGAVQVVTSFATDRWRVNGRADHISMLNEVEFINGGNGTVLESDNWVLYVDDLKYGWRIVSPERNWTLIAHAVGYCINNNVRPDVIALRIHQPRPWHHEGKLREWRISYDELLAFYQQIDATLSNPSNELRTGLDWCAKCRAHATCPAARTAGMNAKDAIESVAFDDQLPNDALAYELDVLRDAAATAKARLTALEDLARHRIEVGQVIDGYGAEPQYANARWKPWVTSAMLTASTKINCAKEAVISPTDFKRLGGSQKVYDALTERPTIGTKLVRATADQRAKRLLGKGAK